MNCADKAMASAAVRKLAEGDSQVRGFLLEVAISGALKKVQDEMKVSGIVEEIPHGYEITRTKHWAL